MEKLDDYNYLDKKIQRLIDYNIEGIRDEITDEQIRKIHLSCIDKCNFSDEEFDYVMNYLNNEGILVVGDVEVLYSDYENYRYKPSRKSKNRNIKFQKLTASEQIELLKKYKDTNDKEILEKLVASYTLLVRTAVLRYSKVYGVETGDLLNVAYEALLKAFNNYDFSTSTITAYVEKYVKGSILGSLKFYYGIDHYTHHSIFLKARDKVKYDHYGEVGYDEYDHIDEIVETFLEDSVGQDEFKDIRMVNMIYSLSLDEVEDRVEASDDVSLYREVLEPIFQKQMNSYVSAMSDGVLNDNQYFAVKYYYGIDEDKSYTLKELAAWKECSHQTIHKDLNSAYEVMLDNWIDYMLEFYDNDNHEYDFTPGGIEYDKPKCKSKDKNNK